MALLAKEVPRDCLTSYLDLPGNNRGIIKSNEKKENVVRPAFFRSSRPIEFSMGFKNPTNKVTLNENQIGMLIQDHDRQNFFNITNLSESFPSVPHCTTILPEDGYIATGTKVAMRNVEPTGPNIKKLKKLADCNVLDALENQRQDCFAVREKNLSGFRWFLIEKESNREKKGDVVKAPSKEVDVFKFPQPENYYRDEEKHVVGSDKIAKILNSGEKSYDGLKFVPHLQGSSLNSSHPVNSTGGRKSAKSKKAFMKNQKETKKSQRKSCDSKTEGRPVKKSDEDRRKFRVHDKCKDCPRKKNRKNREDKKKDKEYGKENRNKYEKNKNKNKEHESRRKERTQAKAKRAKAKEDVFAPCMKEWKKSRGFIPKFVAKSGNGSMCEECMKRSESWFYKWAKGRENHRRNHRLSDWQFARAKSRAHSREGDALWQFNRALGRRNSRNDQYFNFRKRNEKYPRQKDYPSYAFPFSMKKKHVKSFLNLFGLLL